MQIGDFSRAPAAAGEGRRFCNDADARQLGSSVMPQDRHLPAMQPLSVTDSSPALTSGIVIKRIGGVGRPGAVQRTRRVTSDRSAATVGYRPEFVRPRLTA